MMGTAAIQADAAYRSVCLDLRVRTATGAELILLCLSEVSSAIAAALNGARIDDPGRKSAGLTRAIAALTALEMGVDQSGMLAAELMQTYGAAKDVILRSVTCFDSRALQEVAEDFVFLKRAFGEADSTQA